MARKQGLRVEGANDVVDEIMVSGSPTGKEVIMCVGEMGGAAVSLKTSLLVDGERSPVYNIPGDSDYTENFAVEVTVGYKNPIIVSVAGASAGTDLYLSVVTSEV